ncbi:MAG: hypothetical protein L0206_17020, partial [Actinobacteria bacterium]|nr:hypothetical protein [Actinomycetota bacterium]
MRHLAPAAATFLLGACSLFQSDPEEAPARQSFGTFLALSDSETATDYSMTKTAVWVGTTQGLLRYDEGVEAPVRLHTTDGLPGEDITAVGANDDTVWAATPGGLVKIGGGQVEPHISDVPFIGRIRAITVHADGRLWVGGTQGLVRYTGGEWSKWNDRYDVLQAVEAESGLWLATAQNGVAQLKGSTLYEHTVTGGFPAPFARNVIPIGDKDALALAQGIDGSSLAYLHDDRWYTYTLQTDEKLIALVDIDGDPTLVTPTRLLKVVFEVRGIDESSRFILAGVGPERAEPRQYRVSPVPGTASPPPAREVEAPPAPRAPMPPPDESPGDGP